MIEMALVVVAVECYFFDLKEFIEKIEKTRYLVLGIKYRKHKI